VVVPLNTKCPTKCEMPFTSADSSRDPDPIHAPIETLRTWGILSVSTSRPLDRTVFRILREAFFDTRTSSISVAGMRLLKPLLFHSQRRIGPAPPRQRKLAKEVLKRRR